MKKKYSGFTLIEVIVAIAVFAVMSLLASSIYAFIGRMTIDTNGLNQKVDKQAASVENAASLTGDKLSGTHNIVINGISVPIDIYEEDQAALNNALAVPEASRSDAEKEIVKNAQNPSFKYFKTTP